jgi:hypothetical protein
MKEKGLPKMCYTGHQNEERRRGDLQVSGKCVHFDRSRFERRRLGEEISVKGEESKPVKG